MNLNTLLEERTAGHSDKTFLFYQELEVSYTELNSLANRIGNGLHRLGVKKGDKVCLLIPNRPEFLYCFFGVHRVAAVAVPTNVLLKADEIQFIVNNSEATTLIADPLFTEVIDRIRPACSNLRNVVMLTDTPPEDCVPFSTLLECPDIPPRVEVKQDDPASIIYTSGTTGKPKGVVLTHRNYISNARQLSEATRMTEKDRFLCILPLFHVNAQLVTTLAPMYAGGSMVLMEKFSPTTFLPALDRYKATAFSAVPTVYAILNSLPDAERYDLSSLRFCVCGAAPMPVEVFQTFEKKYKAYILEGYGLSEATCASSANPIGGKRKVGSIGLPLKGQEMKIFDDSDRELKQGEIGEIVVRGDVVMKEYCRNPEATAETLRGGWLHTGDLAYQDEDGYFFIVGRKKEMIIRGGENIYPKEIEEVLYRHAGIAEAAVVGVPDAIWGEDVAAFIVPKPGEQMDSERILAYLKERIADYKCPRKVFFWESLPKTATGKIQKNVILEMLDARSP